MCQWGAHYLAQGQHVQAITHLSEAIRSDQHYVAAYELRGIAYHHNAQYEQAISDYTEAMRLGNAQLGLAEMHYYRGLAYHSMSKFDEAIADYKEALRLKPGYEDARNAIALAKEQKPSFWKGIKAVAGVAASIAIGTVAVAGFATEVVTGRKICMYCRREIAFGAVRCPYCTSENP